MPRGRRGVSVARAAHRWARGIPGSISCSASNHPRTHREVAKTHRGLRAQFARIAKDSALIDSDLAEFLARAYELKSLADYGTGAEASISAGTAEAAVQTATRFVDCIARLLAEE